MDLFAIYSIYGRPRRHSPIPGRGDRRLAGGLDALTRLINALPAHPGFALVVVQHLDPWHESKLTDLLAARASIRVEDASHGTRVQPDHAYVIQPNTDVALADGMLSVTARQDARRRP